MGPWYAESELGRRFRSAAANRPPSLPPRVRGKRARARVCVRAPPALTDQTRDLVPSLEAEEREGSGVCHRGRGPDTDPFLPPPSPGQGRSCVKRNTRAAVPVTCRDGARVFPYIN